MVAANWQRQQQQERSRRKSQQQQEQQQQQRTRLHARLWKWLKSKTRSGITKFSFHFHVISPLKNNKTQLDSLSRRHRRPVILRLLPPQQELRQLPLPEQQQDLLWRGEQEEPAAVVVKHRLGMPLGRDPRQEEVPDQPGREGEGRGGGRGTGREVKNNKTVNLLEERFQFFNSKQVA